MRGSARSGPYPRKGVVSACRGLRQVGGQSAVSLSPSLSRPLPAAVRVKERHKWEGIPRGRREKRKQGNIPGWLGSVTPSLNAGPIVAVLFVRLDMIMRFRSRSLSPRAASCWLGRSAFVASRSPGTSFPCDSKFPFCFLLRQYRKVGT